MKTPKPRASAVADPIAGAIEGHLNRIADNGGERLRTTRRGENWDVVFGRSAACGETYEIALVRLARVLLDDAEFKMALMDALRVLSPAESVEVANRPAPASP